MKFQYSIITKAAFLLGLNNGNQIPANCRSSHHQPLYLYRSYSAANVGGLNPTSFETNG